MVVRPYYMDILKKYRDVALVKVLAGVRRCDFGNAQREFD